MEADEGFFGERVAAFYDERSAEASTPEVVGPVVDMLAGFAGDAAALEFGCLPGVQHDLEPHHAGRSGRLLRERRGAPAPGAGGS